MFDRVSRSRLAIWTVVLLVIASAVAIYWLITVREPEPLLTLSVLIATIIGVFADRWVHEAETRKERFGVLTDELFKNCRVFDELIGIGEAAEDVRLYTLPRLYVSSLQTVVASGTFSSKRDSLLNSHLHNWLSSAVQLNQRLNVTEAITVAGLEKEQKQKFVKKLQESKAISNARASLAKLIQCILDDYSHVSGISRDTVIFPSTEDQRKDT